MEFNQLVISFYERLVALQSLKEQDPEALGEVIVDAFRIKAVTTHFLRERMRTDGHVRYL